ncbi:MAG: hypothetical protein NUV51_03795 [Sulfuricaulis sp.]|nr:hypothetical protein [Sulfuricaulis sp.]
MQETLIIPPKLYPRPYIQKFQDRHITLEQIAEALSLSVRMVSHMKKKNLEPRWSIALAIIEFDALNCSTATAQLSQQEMSCQP